MYPSTQKLLARFYLLSGVFFLILLFFSEKGFSEKVHIQPDAIVVSNLSLSQRQQLQNKSPDQLTSLVSVFTVTKNSPNPASSTPIFGSLTFRDNKLIFEPRFNFDSDQTYEYHLSLADEVVIGQFLLKSKPADSTAKVEQIYPSAKVLPENLFKFYIQFNQAMSRGNVYRHISLLDEKHVAVELPFLELTTELWSRDGTRLTLLFDPGRTKQGIKPNRDMGLPLQEGKQFTLVISKNWLDANGQIMLEDFKKTFNVQAQDIQQPNINNWTLDLPDIGSKNSLTVTFDEMLDYALIQDSIDIRNQRGEIISGNISISNNETRWHFSPDQIWQAGQYSLIAKSYLEDLSANSLGRAFEVIRTKDEPLIPDSFSIDFTLSEND